MNNMLLIFMFLLIMEGVLGETVSVTEGDSVTLHTGLNEIKTIDVLEWRFGAVHDRIAQINKAAGDTTIFGDVLDGRFRDRLKLDHQTGSLTITNTRTEHAGDYEVSTTITPFKKSFSIIVVPGTGLSSSEIAGIVVGVLLAVAAPAAGVMYYCHRTKTQML
ncbi:hypothetical protein ABG768_001611 [Culter alburnus]|uniref:Immunoglobulin V-set domain-containing protein n=1 Tax=Culter alburnus TaxID=194366 RepID=A0AAW2A285_CULAL